MNMFRKLYLLVFGGASERVPLLIGMACDQAGAFRSIRAKLCRLILERAHGCFVGQGARIARSVSFPHPTGIVIGAGVVVEDGVKIFQNVTLGSGRVGGAAMNHYPVIGSGTIIYSGAQVLGRVTIGSNCRIGAGAVVLRDVPDHSTAVGVPARIVEGRE